MAITTAMPSSARRFTTAVMVGWVALASAAAVFARMKGISAPVAILVAIAFLVEFPFYLSPAFEWARIRSPWLLALTCVVPWLAYSAPLGLASPAPALMLTGIALLISFWYVALPRHPITDAGFLLLLAGIRLSKVLSLVYLSPIPKVDLSTLGQVMLIRAGATAVLSFRGDTDAQYRFLPDKRECLIGLKWFAFGLPVMTLALWTLGLAQLRPHVNAWLLIPQFFGILWVVALSEEFFFRGLLQRWIGLIAASAAFGLVHLSVHFYPNWRYSIAAAILGLFCGLAYRETRTIQSAMVTHALAATVYRVFFV